MRRNVIVYLIAQYLASGELWAEGEWNVFILRKFYFFVSQVVNEMVIRRFGDEIKGFGFALL